MATVVPKREKNTRFDCRTTTIVGHYNVGGNPDLVESMVEKASPDAKGCFFGLVISLVAKDGICAHSLLVTLDFVQNGSKVMPLSKTSRPPCALMPLVTERWRPSPFRRLGALSTSGNQGRGYCTRSKHHSL